MYVALKRVKWLLLVSGVVIVVGSLWFTNMLTTDLKQQEHKRMELWAEAMRTLSTADEHTNLGIVLKVINENNTIPVIVMGADGSVQTFRNVPLTATTQADSLKQVAAIGKKLLLSHKYIQISLTGESDHDYVNVCYDDSLVLQRLSVYPFVQLGVLIVFVGVMIMTLMVAKRAEQNRLWAGLSKETAHQLGTPISSLMGWVQILREDYPDDLTAVEIEKDVDRLKLIADRFGKIGSKPEMKTEVLQDVVDQVADYINRRTPAGIKVVKAFPEENIMVRMNANLFGWVVENICKNAADAIVDESGVISIAIQRQNDRTIIDISDTGKGIRKKDLHNVFRPGFTTKKRGWGLGLSLAKRIVEEYHHGRIWVRHSEIGVGTTFRIELK